MVRPMYKIFSIFLPALVVALSALTAHAKPVVESIQIEKAGDGINIIVKGTEIPTPESFLWKDTNQIFHINAGILLKTKKQYVRTTATSYVKYGWLQSNPPKSYVTIGLKPGAWFTVVPLEENAGICIKVRVENKPETIAILPPKPLPQSVEKPIATATTDLVESAVAASVGESVKTQEEPKTDEVSMKPAETSVAVAPTPTANPVESKTTVEPKSVSPRLAVPNIASKAKDVTVSGVAAVAAMVKRVSMDFYNAEVGNVLKAIALQSGTNIVIGSGGDRKISVTLSDVTVEQALDMITLLSDLKYTKQGGTYLVADEVTVSRVESHFDTATQSAKDQPLVTKFVSVQYVGTKPLAKAVFWALIDRAKSERLMISNQLGGAVEFRTDPRGVPYVDFRNPGEKESILRAHGVMAQSKAEAGETSKQESGGETGGKVAVGGDEGKTTSENKAQSEQISGQAFLRETLDATDEREDKGEKYLVITGTEAIVKDAEELTRKLDAQYVEAKTAETVIRIYASRFYDPLYLRTALSGGADVKAGAAGSIPGFPSLMINVVSNSNKMILIGKGSDVDRAVNLLDALDPVNPITVTYYAQYADVNQLQAKFLQSAIAPSVKLILGAGPAVNNRDGSSSAASTTAAASSTGAGTETGSASATATAGSNVTPSSLVVIGPEPDVKRAIAFLKEMDSALPQVYIEARVLDIALNDMQSWGFDWNFLNSSTISGEAGTSQTEIKSPSTYDTATTFSITKVWKDFQIDVTLDALFKKHTAKLLARPSIWVMDGRTGRVFIGDDITYIKSKSRDPNTGSINIETGQLSAGIDLNVAPRINIDTKSVTLNIRPEVSFVSGYLDTGDGGKIPQVSRRYADTVIRVNDGDTIAIGGLIKDEDLITLQKVPILGDIPILGYLFQKRTNSKVRSEVVVFITTRIVYPGETLPVAETIPDTLDKKEDKKD